MRDIVSMMVNIINWLLVYNPSYFVGNLFSWIREGFQDGKNGSWMD